ncbi:MAG: hypothetical protein D6744_01410 [Planctomycetota bacterium]|nr:MAG: hypothetical protein D6744_01410 [Planctomycetota bacterium]
MPDWEGAGWDGDDPDAPQECDLNRGESADLAVCPSCGETVYDETQQCPCCGVWIDAGRVPSRPPGRLVGTIVAALLLIAILAYFLSL